MCSSTDKVIESDTLEIAGQRIRFHGIDAPEAGQSCIADGARWACGQNATLALSSMISTNRVAPGRLLWRLARHRCTQGDRCATNPLQRSILQRAPGFMTVS
ncbi:MAG: hypothetical protein O7G83_03160 [Proteobacteria bacterium]|nr:hypothetical protein [Pseudomonadota bacterium]